MGTRLWRATRILESGRKRRWAFLSLLGVLIAALLVGVASCSGGTTTTSSSQGATTTTGHADLQADLGSPAQDVMNAVYTSVVNIAVSGTAGGQSGTGVGSGVIYTSDGYILTNDHVVTLGGAVTSGQTTVVTFSDGSQAPATIVGEDVARDLAAIKVAKTGLNAVTFGKSSAVQLAEWATVIGSPLDFRNTVSLGIVSGLDRTLQISASESLTGLIQIDTAISPGNSGGGCFDAQGHFIGMPEVYLPPGSTGAENIGFMIPADVVASVAKTLTGK
jgi:S1-C subfamily serine protease